MSEAHREDEAPKVPDSLPVLPLRDVVIFPFMIVPLYVSRERSIKAVDQALADNRMILLVAQKRQEDEDPAPGDLHSVGTAAMIMRMLKLPDGRIRVLVQGVTRAQVSEYVESPTHLVARVETVSDGATAPSASLAGRSPDAQRQGRPREVQQPRQAHLHRSGGHRQQHGGTGASGGPDGV